MQAGSIINNTVLYLRSVLASGITDPISGSRPANSNFLMTSYPDRPAKYPIITLKGRKTGAFLLGDNTTNMRVDLAVEIRAWARNDKEKDQLGDSIFYQLYTNKSGTEAQGLYEFKVSSEGDVVEEGKEGIHSKVTECRFFVLV